MFPLVMKRGFSTKIIVFKQPNKNMYKVCSGFMCSPKTNQAIDED
jgi:hypothetical protein